MQRPLLQSLPGMQWPGLRPVSYTHLITRQLLDQAGARLAELGVSLSAEEGAVELLARSGGDREYGARPLRRAVSSLVEDPAADPVSYTHLVGADALDPGTAVSGVGEHPRLPASERDHRIPQSFDGHGAQGDGDLFSSRCV